MQKIAFLAHLGAGSSVVCLHLAHTISLTMLILNSGLTAKVSSYLLTWLKYWPNFVSCFQLWPMTWLENSLRKERSILWSFLWDTLSTFGKKNPAPRPLCLIATDWSVTTNLVSPFLNEFVVLVWNVLVAIEFPAQRCTARRQFQLYHPP